MSRALPVLRRLADITEPDLRSSHLAAVAENVRLLELAANCFMSQVRRLRSSLSLGSGYR